MSSRLQVVQSQLQPITAAKLLRVSHEPEVWDAAIHPRDPAYPYQMEGWNRLCWGLIETFFRNGLVELLFQWARQSGKNTLDARFSVWSMAWFHWLLPQMPYMRATILEAIKTAPTYKPGIEVSKRRLEGELNHLGEFLGLGGKKVFWESQGGYVYRIKMFWRAVWKYLSAGERAARRSETANWMLAMDEAQTSPVEVYNSELGPMRASTGAMAIFWGTGGTEDSLIEIKKDELLALQERTGEKLVHVVDWQEVAQTNERYGKFCDRERDRMGETHPAWLSEYGMKKLERHGKMFLQVELDQFFRGEHGRGSEPRSGFITIGGVDFCGADEQPDEAALNPEWTEHRDNTCGMVGELNWSTYRNEKGELEALARVDLVDMLLLPGQLPELTVNRLEQFFFDKWHCQLVVCDGRGVGDSASKTLKHRRKERIDVLMSNLPDVSRLGYRILTLIKSGRCKLWKGEGAELEEIRSQFTHLEREILPTKLMRWGHPKKKQTVEGKPRSIHDDVPKAVGYMLEAAAQYLAKRGPAKDRDFEPWDEAAAFPT